MGFVETLSIQICHTLTVFTLFLCYPPLFMPSLSYWVLGLFQRGTSKVPFLFP